MSTKPKPRINKNLYPKGKDSRFTYDLGSLIFDKKEPCRSKKEEKQ